MWLNNKYTTIYAIQKYGPVAQPGRVPDFYHFGRKSGCLGFESRRARDVISLNIGFLLNNSAKTMANEFELVETPYHSFIFAIRSPVTRQKYLNRLAYFLSYVAVIGTDCDLLMTILRHPINHHKKLVLYLVNNLLVYRQLERKYQAKG